MTRHFIPPVAASFALVLVCTPSPARAAHGTIDLSWDVCTPVVSDIASPVAGPLRVVASVLGNDQTHKAYSVIFQLGDASDQVPDAWRFDAEGCQGLPLIQINHLPPADLAPACPAFSGNEVPLTLKFYSPMPLDSGLPTTLMRGVMASSYLSPRTADPGQRYHLASFVFDHTNSVIGPTTPGVGCGGFETAIFIKLLVGERPGPTCAYLSASDDIAYPFDAGNILVSVNGSVPAAQTTWGLIKSAYRR